MLNTLRISYKIDFNYAINSFVYSLKKTPIIKNLLSDNLYKKAGFKTFVRILAIICTSLKLIFYRFLYFTIIYYIAKFISKDVVNSFIHIYFVFAIIGMFINTYIMSTSRKKYISIMLFNMDAKKFILSHYFFKSILNLILNALFLFSYSLIIKIPIYMILVLSLFSLFIKNIGEAISVWYYKKNHDRLLTDKTYFTIVIIGLIISLLPYIKIYFYNNVIIISTLISLIFAIISLIYLYKVDNYQLIYKQINNLNTVVNQELASQYSRLEMVSIHDSDKEINEKKIKNKHGYDLFNTIFFERHKYILLRSAKIFALVSLIIVVVVSIINIEFPNYNLVINNFIISHMGWLVIILYFINRGAIVTQAMFFNCDHSMLTFNFYRNPQTILEIFKRRLITLIKINLIPGIVIAIGLPLILFLTGNLNISIDYLAIFVSVICICIFFSVHYLVIYYLLQPYNKDLKMKNPTYSVVNIITYFICYSLTKINFSINIFCLTTIAFTIIYILISLKLVYKKAPMTFTIK